MVRSPQDYEFVMDYIDQNPVKAELAATPVEWKASGAFYKAHNIPGLVDFIQDDSRHNIKLLSPIPPLVSRLMPPAQLEHTLQYFGVYTEAIEQLYSVAKAMLRLGDTLTLRNPPAYLHYFTGTADFFICEYDGEDTMFGKVRFNVYPAETKYQKLSLSNLKSNQFLKLDFTWVPDTQNA